MPSKTGKIKKRSKTVAFVILLIGSFIMLVPFIWMILTSFKTYKETVKIPVVWLPSVWNLDNFNEVLRKLDFARYYKNTITVTILICGLQMFFCSLAAYAFARMRFPGQKIIFFFLLTIFMVPGQMTLIPRYLLMVRLRWVDTLQGIIVPGIFSVYTVFMLKQAFESLPKELEESGKLDGCSYFGIYWTILLPLCKSSLIAMGVLNVLWCWNDLLWPLLMTTTPAMRTLANGIALFQSGS